MQTVDGDIAYQLTPPAPRLSDFVESFWMLANHSETDKNIVVLPDGRFDIFFSHASVEPYHVSLVGIGTEPTQTTLPAKTILFAVSFKLLAVEYLLHQDISPLVNNACHLPDDFWGITSGDLGDFEAFCRKVSATLHGLLPEKTDPRKQKLFDLIYSSSGSVSVKELSAQVYWSSRQINRYFNQQFGISLKGFCNILRFRASFQHIKEGKLFPEQNFSDQAHFIKEVRKFSGVVPKDLSRNKNDRFIQFSTLPKK